MYQTVQPKHFWRVRLGGIVLFIGCLFALWTTPAFAQENIIVDSGFEDGPWAENWAQSSNNYDTIICGSECGGSIELGAADEGQYWAWFGGAVNDESSLSQEIWLPANHTAVLHFSLALPVCAGAQDSMLLYIDGEVIWSIDSSSDLCNLAEYTEIWLDVSNYANDESHTLSFVVQTFAYSDNRGQATSFFVDAVQLDVTPIEESDPLMYLSFSANGSVGGMTIADEDIVVYDHDADTWTMLLDGSDIGIGGTDLDAFDFDESGNLLISLEADNVNVRGVGRVDDADILRFTPETLGWQTSGAFELYFDGSNYGFDPTNANEDIDAIEFAPDGSLIVSTLGNFSVNGVSGMDEDAIIFDPESETWSLYFDGSAYGLAASSEDVWGLSMNDGQTNELYVSTQGNFALPNGETGQGVDIMICNENECWFHFDGSDHGFIPPSLDGIAIDSGGPSVEPTLSAAAQQAEAVDPNDDPTNGDMIGDDEAAPDLNKQLFVPFVSH
jgi:hypothetical protein